MTRPRRFACATLLLLGLAASDAPAAHGEGRIEAGVARATFTVRPGVPLAGYSRRDGAPSSGQHDPVGVRAVVLEDAEQAVAIVSCDLLIIDEHLASAVATRVAQRSPGRPPLLFLAATHTHSGPGAYGRKFLEKLSMGHYEPAVFDALVEHIADTVLRARASRQPVRLAAGREPTTGLVVNRMDPQGPRDAELIICALYPAQEARPFAVLMNFAAHPTTLGASNMQLSADYPGVLVRQLEARWPSATGLFLAGAVGDQAPVKRGEGFERAEWLGGRLAEQATALLERFEPRAPQRLLARQDTLPLPSAAVRLGRWLTLPRWLGRRLVDDDATLSLVVVGDVALHGLPCDVAAPLGQQLKEHARARGLESLAVSFVNDYIGYCIPEPLYRTNAYEASMAFNGPQAGARLVQRSQEMLDQLLGDSRP